MPRASFHSRGGGGSDKNKYKPVTKTPSSKRLTYKQMKKAPANKPTLAEKEIEIVMFNCNRLTEESIIELKSLTSSKLVHFMGIIETWYRQDEFKTNHHLDDYNMFEARRPHSATRGGGIAVYTLKTLPFVVTQRFFPAPDPETAPVLNERIWIEYKASGRKTAICFSYFRCQTPEDEHGHLNNTLYSLLESETQQLKALGYRIFHMGDFNAHIGNSLLNGIRNNTQPTNKNGLRLKRFAKSLDLIIMNSLCSHKTNTCPDRTCANFCEGLWTWSRANQFSVIDYVLAQKNSINDIKKIVIDDQNTFGGYSSDHNMIFITITEKYLNSQPRKHIPSYKTTWAIDPDMDYTDYKTCLNKALPLVDTSTIDSFSLTLSQCIITALTQSVGKRIAVKRQPHRVPFELLTELKIKKTLSTQYKRLLKQSAAEHIENRYRIETDYLLNESIMALREQSSKVATLISNINKNKRRINISKCKGNSIKAQKYFWSFVNNKNKEPLDIVSVETKQGATTQDPQEIMHSITEYLADLFCASTEPTPQTPEIDPLLPGSFRPPNDHSYAAQNTGENTTDHEYYHDSSKPIIRSSSNDK